jgi:hypothetical protein
MRDRLESLSYRDRRNLFSIQELQILRPPQRARVDRKGDGTVMRGATGAFGGGRIAWAKAHAGG